MTLIPSFITISFLIKLNWSGKVCSYLGMEGIGYPVDSCMYQTTPNTEDPAHPFQFAFQFTCGDGTISATYWEGKTTCRGKVDLSMDDFYCAESPDLTGQKCKCIGRGSACDTFTIAMSTEEQCQTEEQSQAQLTSVVVNECIPNGYGGSEYFTCDQSILIMETFTGCNDCSCVGQSSQFDYTYLNDQYCFDIICSAGTRRVENCDTRKRKRRSDMDDILAANDIGFDVGGVNKLGIDFIGKHIQNHHLFVHDLITKHNPSITRGHTAFMPLVGNNGDIFGDDSIWSEHALLIGLMMVFVVISVVSVIIIWWRRSGQYSKI